jgi:hypothetical protein
MSVMDVLAHCEPSGVFCSEDSDVLGAVSDMVLLCDEQLRELVDLDRQSKFRLREQMTCITSQYVSSSRSCLSYCL